MICITIQRTLSVAKVRYLIEDKECFKIFYPRFFAWINLFSLNHILLYSLLYPFQSIQTLPPTMARQEKSLAVCLEILQDYTAKDFSLFAVLTTADFYSHNSQFHFLSHNPNDMKQWHATLSCLSSTAWGKVHLFVGCRLTDQKKHHSLICRTILFAYSTAKKKSLM